MVSEELIARCIRRETRAEYELYKTMYGPLMAICSRYERNLSDAKDRMNQGFLKILENLRHRDTDKPFEPWARRVMINTVIDGFRKERKRKAMETLQDTLPEHTTTGTNDYLQHMDAEELLVLVQQLPPMSRQVFNLFAIDGYPHAEIARLLGISEGTSKWHVAHARIQLQRSLQDLAARNSLKTVDR